MSRYSHLTAWMWITRGDNEQDIEVEISGYVLPPDPDVGIFSPQMEDIVAHDREHNEYELTLEETERAQDLLLAQRD